MISATNISVANWNHTMHDVPTIFLVDDDPLVLDATTILLKTIGYEVRSYTSAEEFLRDFNPVPNSCLIVDIQLKGMNGLELHRLLQSKQHFMPTIFVSGDCNVENVAGGKRESLDVLLKPFKPMELIEKIESAIDNDWSEE